MTDKCDSRGKCANYDGYDYCGSCTRFLHRQDNYNPIELKALTTEELFKKRLVINRQFPSDFGEEDFIKCKEWYLMGVEDADKNGQLKEWLNCKELREAIKALDAFYRESDDDKYYLSGLGCAIMVVTKAFKNLNQE